MRRLLKLGISLMLLASLGSYLYWAEQRPPLGHLLSDLRSQVVLDQGTPRDRGNLLGIQPELVASDYHSSARLRLKLAAHLDKARHDGLLNRKTIVVLPAHIGTLLVATGEKPELYKATNFDQALAWLSVSHPLELPRALLQATGEARLSEALLRIKAPQMARDYQQLFSGLAAQFGITLVAGSVVLPEPRLDDGQLLTGNGPLHNVSLVFGADGAVLGHLQRQNLPSPEGWLFSGAADADLWHSIDTPAGRLGVLIDADGWHLDALSALARQQVELLVVPACGPHQPTGKPDSTWPSLAGSTWRAGIAVFMRGRLWGQDNRQASLVMHADPRAQADDGPGARLTNLWL